METKICILCDFETKGRKCKFICPNCGQLGIVRILSSLIISQVHIQGMDQSFQSRNFRRHLLLYTW